MSKIEDLFEIKPLQWGLRGDPYLWEKLKEILKEMDTNLAPMEFNLLLDNKFHEIINQEGKKIADGMVKMEGFPQSGMSGGIISLVWWKETGLPLLKNRYSNT